MAAEEAGPTPAESAAQKTALLEVQKKLANARKINDWVNLQKQFEQLNKEMEQINRVASFHTAIEVARQAGLKRLEIDMLLELEELDMMRHLKTQR